ncbi:MAG: PHP domain-containing protein [Thaumarchaeota archaeon S14]|nr:MAG: PHP domain-containing protein [Thaumarchaeota archaeon S14]
MRSIRAELHCHNVFSNFNVGPLEAPYDCGVTVREQLDGALAAGLDAIFVTNHNTLDGYAQAREYARTHGRHARIAVYPAEEVTLDDGSHVVAYGISERVRPGMGLGETLDAIRAQGGVSSAPHPFSILDALRERAAECDIIEVFNSNNADIISNARAAAFAAERSMVGVAGSDSHVASTVGRCVNAIDAEDSLDSVLALALLLRAFRSHPDSRLWMLLYRLAVAGMRRISRKINLEGHDASPMAARTLGGMARMAI